METDEFKLNSKLPRVRIALEFAGMVALELSVYSTASTLQALALCRESPLSAAAKSRDTPVAWEGSRLTKTSYASSQAFEKPRAS